MPADSSSIKIPGRDFSIPAVGGDPSSNSGTAAVKSPEWMVSIDEMLSSTVKDFEKFAELFGWYAESSRYSSGDITNQLSSSATLKHSDLIIQIANGGYSSDIETRMNTGKKIDKITIVRLGNIEAEKKKLQEIVYEVCRVQSFQQSLDRLFLTFSVTKRTNTVFVYDSKGAAQGQNATTIDYSTAATGA